MQAMTDSRLESKQIAFEKIPVIDISGLINDSDPLAVAKAIGKACEEVGFFYVKNHGVPQELISKMYEVTKEFFQLPFEEKNRLNVAYSGKTLRGYIPMYAENVDPENTKDFKECFDYGKHGEASSPFFGPNLMPSEFPEFQQTCDEYHDAMLKLGRKLVSAIAISLDLPADYFVKSQKEPITIQRILHYPSQAGKVIKQEEIGIGAHTDYGFLTVLSQDDVGGLQVRNRDGDWISAPPIEGTFIVNIGDLVQTLTNDRYVSTFHRVINASAKERYSVPFFLDLDYDAVVQVVPTCTDESNPPKYQSYTCGQHKYKRFAASYAHLKESV